MTFTLNPRVHAHKPESEKQFQSPFQFVFHITLLYFLTTNRVYGVYFQGVEVDENVEKQRIRKLCFQVVKSERVTTLPRNCLRFRVGWLVVITQCNKDNFLCSLHDSRTSDYHVFDRVFSLSPRFEFFFFLRSARSSQPVYVLSRAVQAS